MKEYVIVDNKIISVIFENLLPLNTVSTAIIGLRYNCLSLENHCETILAKSGTFNQK